MKDLKVIIPYIPFILIMSFILFYPIIWAIHSQTQAQDSSCAILKYSDGGMKICWTKPKITMKNDTIIYQETHDSRKDTKFYPYCINIGTSEEPKRHIMVIDSTGYLYFDGTLIGKAQTEPEDTLLINDKKGIFPPYRLNMEQEPSNLFRNKLTDKIEFIYADTLAIDWKNDKIIITYSELISGNIYTIPSYETIWKNKIGFREDGIVVWKQLKNEVKK